MLYLLFSRWRKRRVQSTSMRKIIIDSDWGGDVLQLASVLLAWPTEYELLGATVTFGNAPLGQNVENAGAILRLLGVDSRVLRYPGAAAPLGVAAQPEGDEAHGSTGLGTVVLRPSVHPEGEVGAVDFLLDSLRREEAGSVTLVATGPQSNVAEAIGRAPETMRRLKEIRIMGGCVRDIPGYRVDGALERVGSEKIPRRGNITEYAEFNFQQAPEDAATVLESGIPIALFPMDCTHQLTFTEEREALLRKALAEKGPLVEQLVGLLRAPELIDLRKFECSPVMHDVHTTVSLVRPELYEGRRGRVMVSVEGQEAGKTCFHSSESGPHWVAERMVDPDAVFAVLLAALRRCLLL